MRKSVVKNGALLVAMATVVVASLLISFLPATPEESTCKGRAECLKGEVTDIVDGVVRISTHENLLEFMDTPCRLQWVMA